MRRTSVVGGAHDVDREEWLDIAAVCAPAYYTFGMRKLLSALVVAGLCSCEQRFSSNPPLLGPGAPGPSSLETAEAGPGSAALETAEAGLGSAAAPASSFAETSDAEANDASAQSGAAAGADAAAARRRAESSHALTVMVCSPDVPSCPPSETDASADEAYRVVFGSGRGVVRSRGQAATDLYNELRDRTALGERVDAEVVARDAIATAPRGASPLRSTIRLEIAKNDPLARSAFLLLDLVDERGEVTLDVVHWSGLSRCVVSLNALQGDGGAPQCLLNEPERANRPKSPFSW